MTSTANITENLAVAEVLINEAVESGASVIVLPEMFAIFGTDAKSKIDVAEPFSQGPIQDFLGKQAKKHGIWLVAGTIPLVCEDHNKIRASCLVFDDKGKIAARYDKIHLFDVRINEKETYQESQTTENGKNLVVVDTPVGKIGLAVCYDIRFPEMFRQLFNLGAEIFVIPAAFTTTTGEAHWGLLARARAVENLCYVVGSCQTGRHQNGRETYGHSMIISPWGEVRAILENDVGVITTEIDLNYLCELRYKMPIAAHQKFFIDSL